MNRQATVCPGDCAEATPALISIILCCVLLSTVAAFPLQRYYEEEAGESEISEAEEDQEVAVTKRGRAVKLPAKYKAEVTLLPPCLSRSAVPVSIEKAAFNYTETKRQECCSAPPLCRN